MGMLRGLAEAGADVVMHGLVTADEAKAKTSKIASEFGVQCRHSAADVTKPAEIRYWFPSLHSPLLPAGPERSPPMLACPNLTPSQNSSVPAASCTNVCIVQECPPHVQGLLIPTPAISNDSAFTSFGCVQGHDKGHP